MTGVPWADFTTEEHGTITRLFNAAVELPVDCAEAPGGLVTELGGVIVGEMRGAVARAREADRLVAAARDLPTVKEACVAVVRERIAGGGLTLEEHLVAVVADSILNDLGMPWSAEREAAATPLEKEAQLVIQASWRRAAEDAKPPGYRALPLMDVVALVRSLRRNAAQGDAAGQYAVGYRQALDEVLRRLGMPS